jgi:hypothetical protein
MLTDQQFAELITVLKPLSDYAALQLSKEKRGNAPNLLRPLADYAGFDWEHHIPGCVIIAQDRDGATEVEHDGRVYRRYRSAEDDAKGRDIRYRRVVSGTVAEKNCVWATLIAFREPKAVRPLNSSVREAVAEGQAAKSKTATPTPTQPQPPVNVASATDDTTPRGRWATAMRAARAAGAQPHGNLDLDPSETEAQTEYKTASLICIALCAAARRDMAGTAADEFVRDCEAARIAYSDAKSAGAEVRPDLALTLTDTLTTIGLKLSTLTNLRDAARRTSMDRSKSTTRAPQPSAADVVIERLNSAAGRYANKPMTKAQDWMTVRALEALCGSEALRHAFTSAVFGQPSYKDLSIPRRLALHEWLKPAGDESKASATNASASAEAAAVLATVKARQPEAVPA